MVSLVEDHRIHFVAQSGSQVLSSLLGTSWPIDSASPTGECARTGQIVHIPDWDAIPVDRYPGSPIRRLTDEKSTLHIPMVRDGSAVGVLAFTGGPRGGFADTEIGLLQNFANQAAIAVKNARLLREIEQRNTELGESLELQTATSQVLALISANPGDLATVLDGILARARELVGAQFGGVYLRRSDVMRCEAVLARDHPVGHELPFDYFSAVFADRSLTVENDYAPSTVSSTEWTAESAVLGIPRRIRAALRQDGELIGFITLYKSGEPFGDRDALVLETFAAQATIAISNAKLFNDLDAALERQTAMTDVLDVVSTARTDLQPVYDTVVRHAERLCAGTGAAIHLVEGDTVRNVAISPQFAHLAGRVVPIDESTATGTIVLTGAIVHIRDTLGLAGDEQTNSSSCLNLWRSTLGLPMRRNGAVIGTIAVFREAPGGYTDTEIDLLQTFANQAAIAVDNARLLREIEQRNSDLGESLELQTATSDVLRLISAHPGELRTVLDGIVTTAARLCDADFGGIVVQLDDVMRIAGVYGARVGLTHGQAFAPLRVTLEARDRRQTVLVDDMATREESWAVSELGIGSFASTPMLSDGAWLGNINLARLGVRQF